MTIKERWERGTPHHPSAEELKDFLLQSGIADELDLKFGGDGDNGEDLLMAVSEFYDKKDSDEYWAFFGKEIFRN